MSVDVAARYRNTGTAAWGNGVDMIYDTDQKVSPLVTRTDISSASRFTLNAAGVWLIVVNHAITSMNGLYLRTNNVATGGGAVAGSSAVAAYNNITCLHEFNYGQNLWVFKQGTSGAMIQGTDPDLNYISFAFLGAI
jgi:hypothetical protein